jgi:hypothetical protein
VIFILDHVTITSDRRKQMAAKEPGPLPKAIWSPVKNSEAIDPSL